MLNSIALTGRLTKDVDLRYTQSGTAVGSFTIAVDRQFRSANGSRETDFINCAIWRKSAENFANFTHKGSLVGIEGHIQTRTYDNAQGQKVFVTGVIVENFALLEPRQMSQDSQQRSANNPAAASQSNGFANNGQPADISDDDLPF
ncbi:single-stranded DNA-binding protein [Lacticaseibacillus rhamnosus]|uniref:single-stranded DNA-binding protein n=1 Tax=Lacticaseibacillus rhamnosus TaxID=47715 RepID=UPI001013D061|nr:single-stranded DNA-binding protein [Lacticaseibacillus rhamnosus]RXS52016.1 single-stranded DNA-binding protein [Lacticaseibacillus rhamnosus]